MHNHTPNALFNDARKNGECGWQTGIPFGEDIDVGTNDPGLVKGGVDGFLHVLAIEIDGGFRGLAVEKNLVS